MIPCCDMENKLLFPPMADMCQLTSDFIRRLVLGGMGPNLHDVFLNSGFPFALLHPSFFCFVHEKICMHLCMYICISAHVNVEMCVRTCVRLHVCMLSYAPMQACLYGGQGVRNEGKGE